jgi:hypothetical protein
MDDSTEYCEDCDLKTLDQKITGWFGRDDVWKVLEQIVTLAEADRTDQGEEHYKCSLDGPVVEDVISSISPEPEPLINWPN